MAAFYESPGFGGPSQFSNEIAGAKFVRADRSPCPVCGHPTGDCTGESGTPKQIWGYNTNSTLDDSLTFYMDFDYYEEREIAPGITTKILIHKKGKNIPLSEAKALGFIK